MAKRKFSVNFKNAVIDIGNMTITEVNKDDVKMYSLRDTLAQFSDVDGVTLSISTDEELSEVDDDSEVNIDNDES